MKPKEGKALLEQGTEWGATRPHPLRSLFTSLFLLDVVRDPQSWPTVFWAAATLLLGTMVYHWLEGWSYLDALYFCVVSLATVGYGDLSPKTPLAKAFTILYIINGVVILLALFDRIRTVRTQRIQARTHLRRDHGEAAGPDQS